MEQVRVIEMSALWIAGFIMFLLLGMFFALALCRCAGLADREVAQYLVDKDLSRTATTNLSGNREEPIQGQNDNTAPLLSHPSPLSD
jgi:hypothetical protein